MSLKHILPILRSRSVELSTRHGGRETNGPITKLQGALLVTEQEMRKRLEALRIEHRDLDAAIEALSASGSSDQLQIARLKKRKLLLKDQIAILEDYLIPDIIA